MTSPAPPILEIRDLEVCYREVRAVRGVDLVIETPEILALLGPSGCGKTSLLRTIAGFEPPEAGRVTLAGTLVASREGEVPPEKRQVGMVFQEGALFPHLTVLDNVAYGLVGRPGAAERAREALALVGLSELDGRYPNELSGGQQQRVALARALAPSPRLVLLDEPFASLDAALRLRVRDEVRQILQRAGATAILVTHDQEEAFSFADRVAVMSEGQILQIGEPAEIYQRPASLEVARFVGDGQLFECTVSSGEVTSRFGRVPACDSSAVKEGPGLLWVRSEDLLLGAEQGAAVAGQLMGERFFGHDRLQEVLLDEGQRVQVRSMSGAALPAGSRVGLSLRPKCYPVFAANAGRD